MRLTEQEAEQEMMNIAVAMSDSVLREPEEPEQHRLEQQHQYQLQRQVELDRELAIALANFERCGLEQEMDQAVEEEEVVEDVAEEVEVVAELNWGEMARVQENAIIWRRAIGAIQQNPVPVGRGAAVVPATAPTINMETIRVDEFVCRQDDMPYFGLDPMYYEYRFVPVKFSEDHQWPLAAVFNQLEELTIDRGNEDVVEWREGQSENDRCLICLTNVATRLAVPCGHRQSCRECIGSVIATTTSDQYFFAVSHGGDYVETPFEIPVRCLVCRCIIGMIIVCH